MGRAAHEVNNALNGAVMNLEVVRLRARPGADGGAAAPFAATAAEELERSAALVGALIALTRAPRTGGGSVDVREVLQQVSTLLAPAALQRGVTVAIDAGTGGMGTGAPLIGVRLGITAALLVSIEAAEQALAVEPGRGDSAGEPARLLRCTLRRDPGPTLRLRGAGASLPALSAVDPGTLAVLGAAGIDLHADGDVLVLRCPTP